MKIKKTNFFCVFHNFKIIKVFYSIFAKVYHTFLFIFKFSTVSLNNYTRNLKILYKKPEVHLFRVYTKVYYFRKCLPLLVYLVFFVSFLLCLPYFF